MAEKKICIRKKAATAAAPKKKEPAHIGLVKNDSWFEPFEGAIRGRHDHAQWKLEQLTKKGKIKLSDFATGHLYFGLHKTTRGGWVFREWAPNATEIYLIGDFNNWQENEKYKLKRIEGTGNWELKLPAKAMKHGDLYKMKVKWNGGEGERIPAWCQRVVQDDTTKIFSAQVWAPEKPYVFKKKTFKPSKNPLLIYECHVGMGQDAEKVGTYKEFTENVLPRVIEDGYNCIQVMAIQEHPYYGSFGYHVSSFFAPSSRFGTPEELKHLIDDAHGYGLQVIMDLVHSHAVKNTVEGLGAFDGSRDLFFEIEHSAWDSLCFNYAKNEVLHFLLSNCQYWIQEFDLDGFRFDGVTSMLYRSHGLGDAFGSYDDYYSPNSNGDAICYLTLANKLIHEIKPKAVTIAEDVSGMHGWGGPFKNGGMGFDYRLAMGVPEVWIKLIKEFSDERWVTRASWWELTNRRKDEKTIRSAESHDQALVGDKTILFRLIDADMYWHMRKDDRNLNVDRGMALHKISRLLTASTMNGGYLNFMGNEFGHPEWVDFPRAGNGWSHKYARRQWSLAENPELKYEALGLFDRDLMHLITDNKKAFQSTLLERCNNHGDQILAFQRGDLLFVVNLNPTKSFTDYGMLTEAG